MYVYKRVVLPFFLEKEERIDGTLNELQTNLTAVSASALRHGAQVAQQALLEAFRKVFLGFFHDINHFFFFV